MGKGSGGKLHTPRGTPYSFQVISPDNKIKAKINYL